MMSREAKLFGHRIHPMLIPFPLGLLSTSIVFDIVYLLTDSGKWSEIAFWMIAAGVIGGLAAIVFGVIDFARVPDGTRAHSIGVVHALLSVSMVVLFAVSWLLRMDAPGEPGVLAIILSLLGASLAVVTGWFGGELVERLGVGVADGAHLDAPNSLSRSPAGDRPTNREEGEDSIAKADND
jgi:uncharacterized membrane protein